MTAVSLLSAPTGGASVASPAPGREAGESETRFDEIIVLVRESAAGAAESPSNDGVVDDPASSGDVVIGSGGTQADARDIAAAAALLGGVDGASAIDESGAGETATTQVDPTSVGPAAESPRVSIAVAGSEMLRDVAVRATAPAGAPTAASAVAAADASAPQVGTGSAPALEARVAPLSGDVAAVAAVPSSEADEPRLPAPVQSAGSPESGGQRAGATPPSPPPRLSSSLPAPIGSYTQILAAAESAAHDAEGITDVALPTGDRGVAVAVAAAPPGPAAGAASGAAPVPPMAPVLTPTAPLAAAPDVAPDGARTVAAQVAPAVLSIAQRPAGAHQLTMTLNPDSLGPVTVRANIGQAGDVQVELIGGTDAGRDALRSLVADLRRDLASVSPHATLSVSTGVAADSGAGRGGHPGSETAVGEQGAPRDGAPPQLGHRAATDRTDDLAQVIRISTSTFAGVGEGLDTFA